jgi:serine protease Do
VASRVAKQLIAYGKVTRGYIGATVQDITPEIAASLGVPPRSGALVADVTPDGPSAKGGLESGDLILKIDGNPVTSASDLTRQVALVHPGDEVRLQIRRSGRLQDVTVRSGTRPSEEALALDDGGAPVPGHGRGALGLMVAPKAGGGLTIEGVSPGSDAAEKGVRPGDVIEQVSGRDVKSAADVRQAIAAARSAGRDSVLVRLAHNGQHLYVPLDIDKGGSDKGGSDRGGSDRG